MDNFYIGTIVNGGHKRGHKFLKLKNVEMDWVEFQKFMGLFWKHAKGGNQQ